MTLRTRIFLVYLLIIGGSYVYLISWILDGIRPRYLESMEESLNDTVAFLASVAEQHTDAAGSFDLAPLRRTFDSAVARTLDAQVYSIRKTSIDLRVYLTDADGIVLYDSDRGRAEGKDYSRRNDVYLTLRGRYGARATKMIEGDESSLAIHVAAPVRAGEKIVGVLSAGKPTRYVNELVATARSRVLVAGLIGGGLVLGVGIAFSIWIMTPIEKLTAYARAVRDGRPATLPRLAGREVGDLRRAFEQMRAALEGKDHVERYTQQLAHEIKAPLSAIRGAAELLAEDAATMPPAQRDKFLANLRHESARIQQIVDKLLQLSALEARKGLADFAPVELGALVREALAACEPARHTRNLTLTLHAPEPVTVRGERFLLAQAVMNLLQNALDFTPPGGAITVTLAAAENRRATLTVEDTGPGIPEYALGKVFDRFYSLPRPDTGAKSTGLGLSFVREVATLHGGEITLTNRPSIGAQATLVLGV